MSQVYGPLTLPSGKVIKFRNPTGLDRMNVTQMVPMDQDNVVTGSLLINLYVQAKVVTEVDGKVPDPNYKNLFNEWNDMDVQYYQAVHSEMFGMTEAKMADAKEKAAFLLGNSTSTDGFSSQSLASAPSTDGSASTAI
ncbi:hypothetical protein DEAC_c17010 [Desulfosporosinus acididurans]|uniref:Phage XkdN-like protein n=1 Tax=Desulfosporosinus acididurans TaxID=476652 RepID=A0A0J1FSN0_9FIRM|nr:hypothetical protein [Desulfosporosinus acididurans]KLU66302.1 hypothetical protein DEAC_c17010 [Desulfosporosinus acididurans]